MSLRLLTRSALLATAACLALTGVAVGAETPAAAARPATVDSAVPGPSPAVGVLNILRPDGRVQQSCTAAVVPSEHRGLIVTTASCLASSGATGGYYPGFEFLPGHSPAKPRPFGTFRGLVPTVPQQWFDSQDERFDIGFLSVRRNEFNQRLGDVTGEHGFAVDEPVAAARTLIGHQNDLSLKSCDGTTYAHNANRVGVRCAFEQNAGGAPWLKDFNPESRLGQVNGVISAGAPGVVTSSYFGAEIGKLFRSRQFS